MKGKNFARITLLILFILFIALYFTSNSSYFDYEAASRATLTKEQIEQFEKDVQDGKEIDAKNYLKINEKNYNNAISSTTFHISQAIGNTIQKGLNYIFGAMENAMKN